MPRFIVIHRSAATELETKHRPMYYPTPTPLAAHQSLCDYKGGHHF